MLKMDARFCLTDVKIWLRNFIFIWFDMRRSVFSLANDSYTSSPKIRAKKYLQTLQYFA